MTKASTLTEIIQALEKPTFFFQKIQILNILRNLAVCVALYGPKKSNRTLSVQVGHCQMAKLTNVRIQRFEWINFLPNSNMGGKKSERVQKPRWASLQR